MGVLLFTALLLISNSVSSQTDTLTSREKAKKLYISLTGTQPNKSELNYLVGKIDSDKGDNEEVFKAGLDIIDQKPQGVIKNGGAFYGVTIKDWVTPKFNKQKTTLAPLNDASSTIIGMIRDEKPFNTILYENVVYKAVGVTSIGIKFWSFDTLYPVLPKVANAQAICEKAGLGVLKTGEFKIIYNDPQFPDDPNLRKCQKTKIVNNHPGNVDEDGVKLNPLPFVDLASARVNDMLYLPDLDLMIKNNMINTTNEHYESISEQGVDLSNPKLLVPVKQDGKLHGEPDAISGILSTRAFGAAYLYAGTNRAPVAYVLEHFLCKDMEELNDTTIPDYRNRRDVDRSPGGSSVLYKNRCIGCHAGLDALSGAFAYYDYNGKVSYTPGDVVKKMNHNAFFSEGFVTSDNSWKNLWVQGQNAALGWGSTVEGQGARSLGEMFANTEAFHSCMARQAYEKVCMKSASSSVDKERVKTLTADYKENNFNMKRLFIKASLTCLGD